MLAISVPSPYGTTHTSEKHGRGGIHGDQDFMIYVENKVYQSYRGDTKEHTPPPDDLPFQPGKGKKWKSMGHVRGGITIRNDYMTIVPVACASLLGSAR